MAKYKNVLNCVRKVSSESLQIAKTRYQAGKVAFEKGQYREAVEQLEKASALLARNTRFAGEVKIWLVTAYDAAGRTEDSLSLCEELTSHLHPEVSKQAKELLYILKAPRLSRPKEWLTEIPDLGAVGENPGNVRLPVHSQSSRQRRAPEPDFVDLRLVNTRDNRFIWVALVAVVVTLGGLVWFGFF
jgi:tetratricopeptide (TPR) repeat protein